MEKRITAGLIPYRFNKEKGEWEAYLQFRYPTMWYKPDEYAFFGGALEEGETPEEAVVREIKEELAIDIDASNLSFFEVHEGDDIHMTIYSMPVGSDFESNVEVLEGVHGKFLSESDLDTLPTITDPEKSMLQRLFAQEEDKQAK